MVKLGLPGEPDANAIRLNYDSYRLAFRDVGRNTDARTVIATVLPPKRFCPHTVSLEQVYFDSVSTLAGYVSGQYLDHSQRLYLTSLFNSYVFDWFTRQSVTAHVSFFFIYNTPVPRLMAADSQFSLIVARAARLICTTPEFDDLAKAVGLKAQSPHPSPLPAGEGTSQRSAAKTSQYGATAPTERAQLRAELDGLVAHLYGLTEAEFVHILGTFPLVAQPVKVAAQNAYRDVERGLIK